MLQSLYLLRFFPYFVDMMNKKKNVFQRFLQLAHLPSDTHKQKVNKGYLMLMASHFTLVSLVTGTIFLTNGLFWVSCLPYSYTIISTISLLIFLRTNNFRFFRNTQLSLVLLLPFLIHLVLGGFISSSTAILWSIVCPLAALFFITIRQSTYWFSAYLILVFLGYLIDDKLLIYDKASLPEFLVDTMFLINVVGVSILVFLVQYYFAKNERTLKEEVKKTHEKLSRHHEALTLEQGKTKQVLQKIENLFGQQVSLEVAKELIAQENDFESKSYDVTILFLDIRDFSKFADNKKPAEVASFQNIVFGELLNTIREHKGITNQILGDGIMAVFGAPVQNDSHVLDAVKAGYALIGKINELNELKKIPPTRIGIGLHTGNVVAGNIGNDFRKVYTLTGSTVNIASRIEQLNKVYNSQFLISEAVKIGIRYKGYPVTYVEDVSLRGIENSMKIYNLL